MSGGVDSSVAAAFLKKGGKFEVIGCHMKCWSAWDQCSIERDAEDARSVAEKLDIPFYIFDFEREYRERVFDYMVREYAAGRTPNPDVFCNSEIKFGIFLEKALTLGADYVATGHHVRTMNRESGISLFTAKDLNKDQSYFLWRLNQNKLRHVIFPIGDYLKSEVREMARKFGLHNADKKDSQGLCFVGQIKFDDFLREILPKNPGPIITTFGKMVGEHDGLNFYTIGQRHGIRVGGTAEPLYVAEKKYAVNTLVVAEGDMDPALYRKEVEVLDVSWISGQAPVLPLECKARIRYRQPLQRCQLLKTNSPALPAGRYKLKAVFNDPQRAITPGQSVVFYQGAEMLGGGIII